MDHDAMRRAAAMPLSGPAATDTLAASGGLELPEGAPRAAEAPEREGEPEPIPGEHDHSTEPPTQPGIVGTTGYGTDLPAEQGDSTLDDEGRKQVKWEGGGRR